MAKLKVMEKKVKKIITCTATYIVFNVFFKTTIQMLSVLLVLWENRCIASIIKNKICTQMQHIFSLSVKDMGEKSMITDWNTGFQI